MYKVDFLHAVRCPLKQQFNCAIFVMCSQTYPGMLKVLWNDKLTVSPERDELLHFLFACSQIFMESTIKSCKFCSVLWSMLKSALKYISNVDFGKKMTINVSFYGFKRCTIVAFAILRKAYFSGKFRSRVIDENVFAMSISLQDLLIFGISKIIWGINFIFGM